LSLQLQSEIAKKQKHRENYLKYRKRVEEINVEISVLTAKRLSDEAIVKEGRDAKKRLPDVIHQIYEKREEFESVLRNIKADKNAKQDEKAKYPSLKLLSLTNNDLKNKKILLVL
jgi:hypothetical protein